MKDIIITAMLVLSVPVTAQILNDIQKYDAAESSYEADMPERTDIENSSAYSMFAHPALVGLLTEGKVRQNGMIRIRMTNDIAHGDYLHYKGNHTTDAKVTAGGEIPVKGVGTLYGHACYGREKQRSMYQNYAIRPTDYMPYFVSDSISGGDAVNEHYLIEGGLSMKKDAWRYGVSGFYEGIASAKETQPRRSVYSYWFRLTFSAAKIMPKWILAVKAYPEINKQSVSASGSKRTYRFMQFYGFGLWNKKESTTGYGYGRDAKILGAGGEVLLKLLPENKIIRNASLTLAYNYRWMQTEESSFKNLYATKTHHMSHRLAVSAALNSRTGLHLLLEGAENFRKGVENVYESQKVDDEQSLYDYVLVGTNKLYSCTGFYESLRIKAIWQAAPHHCLSLTAGIRADSYIEKYDMPVISIENHTLTPSLGIGYRMERKSGSLDCDLSASYRTRLCNKYDYSTDSQNSFETALAYIPYLLRGEDRWQVQSSVIYAHKIRKGSLGATLSAKYSKRVDAPYLPGRETGYGITRNDKGIDISLFYVF